MQTIFSEFSFCKGKQLRNLKTASALSILLIHLICVHIFVYLYVIQFFCSLKKFLQLGNDGAHLFVCTKRMASVYMCVKRPQVGCTNWVTWQRKNQDQLTQKGSNPQKHGQAKLADADLVGSNFLFIRTITTDYQWQICT